MGDNKYFVFVAAFLMQTAGLSYGLNQINITISAKPNVFKIITPV